ncbi:hypothetical protein [Neobacillus sp. SAB-20_R2A]
MNVKKNTKLLLMLMFIGSLLFGYSQTGSQNAEAKSIGQKN